MSFLGDSSLDRLRETADQPDLSGTRYSLVRRLGQGGMGTVWLARDSELHREIALKVLRDPDPTGELSARLRTEATLLAKLEHPNIVPIHDAGVLPDGRVYTAMKLVRGERLDQWRNHLPSRPAVLRMFLKVCDAIAFAHAHGVIHRDLKPENVMVGMFGEALVVDWGIARVFRDETTTGEFPPETPGIVGTPSYMSPEQARGELHAIDERTDVHALGGVLYFLLTGLKPFDGDDTDEVVRQVIHDAPMPPRSIHPGLPKALQAICLKAMSKDPNDRYESVIALTHDVDRFLDGIPVAAHPENILEKTLRFLGRNRALAGLVLAYLFMRIAVLVFYGK